MVGADAGRHIGVERGSAHAGRMPVDVIREAGAQLRHLGLVAGDDAGEVHHLGHADGAMPAQQALDVAGGEGPARRLKTRRGHARGRHHVDVERQVGAAVEQPVDAVGAEHVGDLVRVGDDRRRAVRQDRAGELVNRQLRGLDVHVSVDETGNQVGALDVQPLATVVATEADDVAVLDGDVDVEPLLGEDRKHPTARQHELGRLVPPRDCHPLRVDDGQDTAAAPGGMAGAEGFEPSALGFGDRCSNQAELRAYGRAQILPHPPGYGRRCQSDLRRPCGPSALLRPPMLAYAPLAAGSATG